MTNWGSAKLVGLFAAAGLIIAGVTGMMMKDTYISKAVLRMKSDPDALANAETKALSRTSLSSVIMNSGVYHEELAREPLEDVIERMRTRDIHIQVMHPVKPSDKDAFEVSFSYPDPQKAQQVTQLLVTRLADNMPASPGQNLEMLDTPNVPTHPFYPNRPIIALVGLGIGVVTGMVIAGLRKLRRQTLIFAMLFGIAGAFISVVPSYLLAPNYYTSRSVIRVEHPEDLKTISAALRSEIALRHLNAGFGEQGKTLALSITVTDRDPVTALGINSQLITIAQKQSTSSEMLDNPTLPASPSGPNRYIIALLGLGAGILSGGTTARVRSGLKHA
jgi:uncharacterized protein involved in exopolysaccharide biosynthesis